jgi:hypothetical protein
MTSPRLFALLIALVGASASSRAVDVVAAPLDAAAIGQMQSASLLSGHRVEPGDVLLANGSFQVIVFAQPRKGDQGRVGRVLFLSPTGAAETFVFEGGPINDWERGELGRGDQLAVVRFQRQSTDWSAELVVQMPDRTSWVEVTTTIRNSGQTTLEIPVVDVVRGPADAKLADDRKGLVAIGKVDAPTLALLRLNGGVTPTQSARGEWLLGHPSSDPRGNAVSRIGKRLFRMGKNETAAPIEAGDSWTGDLKDRKNWHRIPPGQTRTIHRRLVFGATGASVRPTLAVAGKTPPAPLHFVPAGQGDRSKGSLADRARSFVRRPPAQASQPPATPAPTAKPTAPPSMTIVAKPTPNAPLNMEPVPVGRVASPPPNSETIKAKPVDDLPKVINDAIDQVGDLPPPIK